MASLVEIPKLVKKHGRIAPCWKAIDLHLLRDGVRQGKTLAQIANILPALWFFQPKFRAMILQLAIQQDERIRRCTQPSAMSEYPPHEGLEEVELREFSDEVVELINQLLKLPEVDYQITLQRMSKLMQDLHEWNTKAHLKASKRLQLHKSHPQPRKRSGKYGVEEEQPKLEKST